MKTTKCIRRLLLLVLLIFGFLIATPQKSSASTIGMLAKIMDIVHKVDPSYPTGDQILASQNLINCIAGGKFAMDCIDVYGGALADNEYADVIVTIARIYLAVDNDPPQLWTIVGLIGHLIGDDAPCIIANIVLPGAGGWICDTIMEVIKSFEDAWNATKAFFEGLGDAALGMAEAGYCAATSFVGGCSSSGQSVSCTPIESGVFTKAFEPRLDNGVDSIKHSDLAYESLLEYPIADARAMLCSPISCTVPGIGTIPYCYPLQDEGIKNFAITRALERFKDLVDKKWSTYIVQEGLVAMAAEREEYFSRSHNVDLAARVVLQQYESHLLGFLPLRVVNFCTENLPGLSQHSDMIDRWMKSHATEATNLMLWDSNTWCEKVFWPEHKKDFAWRFRRYVESHGCPVKEVSEIRPTYSAIAGNNVLSEKDAMGVIEKKKVVNGSNLATPAFILQCETTETYDRCRDIMSSVDQEQACIQ